MSCSFFVVKNLPNVDTLAETDDLGYDKCTTKKHF